MSAAYHLVLLNPAGNNLFSLNRFSTMELTLVESDLSTLVLNLPGIFKPKQFEPDQMALVFREYGRHHELIGQRAWFLNYMEHAIDTNDAVSTKLEFSDSNILFERRFLPYTQDTNFMIKDGFALDLMNAFVRESMGVLASDQDGVADPDRYLEPDHLIIPNDTGTGPLIHIEPGNVSIMSVLQDIVKSSATLETYVGFEMILKSLIGPKFAFRSYINQRGIDRRVSSQNTAITLSHAAGNIKEPVLIRDFKSMKNVAYVGGTGQGADKTIVSVESTDLLRLGPFARSEGYVNASNSDEGDLYLEQSGYEFLRENFPSESFRATISQTDAFQFVRDFNFGDILNVRAFAQAITARIWKLYIGLSGGEERIIAHLEKVDVPVS